MSSFDMEPVDEAQFEAFLEGRDELSTLLRKMPQPKARAEVDAAIFAYVAADLPAPTSVSTAGRETIEKNPPKAANQANFLQRWRVPLGLAASAMLAFPLLLLWQNGAFHQQKAEIAAEVEVAAASAPALEPQEKPAEAQTLPAAERAVQEVVLAPPVAATSVDKAAKPQTEVLAEKKAENDAASGKIAQESKGELALKAAREARNQAVALADQEARQIADARKQAENLEKQKIERELLAKADVEQFATAKKSKRGGNEEATSSYAGAAAPRAVAAAPAPAPAAPVMAAAAPPPPVAAAPASKSEAVAQPKAWLTLIEELLKANMQQEALEEWAKFRKTYPQFPVEPRLLEKIKLLQQK